MEKIFGIFYFVLIFAGLICFIWQIIDTIKIRNQWKWDDRNPYRRYCRKCGNCQNYFVYYTEPEIPIGWEFVGKIVPCDQCKPHLVLGKLEYKPC